MSYLLVIFLNAIKLCSTSRFETDCTLPGQLINHGSKVPVRWWTSSQRLFWIWTAHDIKASCAIWDVSTQILKCNIYIAHKNSFFLILSAFFESGEGAKAFFYSRHLRGYRLAVEKITHISLLFFFGLFLHSTDMAKVGHCAKSGATRTVPQLFLQQPERFSLPFWGLKMCTNEASSLFPHGM